MDNNNEETVNKVSKLNKRLNKNRAIKAEVQKQFEQMHNDRRNLIQNLGKREEQLKQLRNKHIDILKLEQITLKQYLKVQKDKNKRKDKERQQSILLVTDCFLEEIELKKTKQIQQMRKMERDIQDKVKKFELNTHSLEKIVKLEQQLLFQQEHLIQQISRLLEGSDSKMGSL